MEDILNIINERLKVDNKTISIAPNSIFVALSQPGASDAYFSEIVNAITNKLRNEIILLKEKLLPVMKDYSILVESKLAEIKNTNDIAMYSIKEVSMPSIVPVLKENGIISEKRAILELPITTLSIPVPEDIRLAFKHKSASIDTYANAIVSQYTDVELSDIWDKYLSNISGSNTNLVTITYKAFTKVNDLVLLYLAVSNLLDAKPANVKFPDDSYKQQINLLYSEILNWLAMAIFEENDARKVEKLVLYSKDKYTIVVHSDVYDKFIKDGNTPEVLLGMLLGNIETSNMFMSDILIKKDAYLSAWNKKVKLASLVAMPEHIHRHKMTYILCIQKLYKDNIPNDILQYVSYSLESLEKELETILNNGKYSDSMLLDIKAMAREIVAGMIFKQTSFYKFTGYMLEYSKIDSRLVPAELASIAAAEIIIDYILEQISVEK